MATHIRTWPGSGCITLTDMTNAGKRGRTCRTSRRLTAAGVKLHGFCGMD
ncbi:MAG TPA: hypothetical protein VD866_12645 [Urbifossiella sp.]|nr:hypothetical protein [Urbifossiella sp.]